MAGEDWKALMILPNYFQLNATVTNLHSCADTFIIKPVHTSGAFVVCYNDDHNFSPYMTFISSYSDPLARSGGPLFRGSK